MRSINQIFRFLKDDVWCYALLGFGFTFRLFYIFIFTRPESYIWSDSAVYDGQALQMAKNQYVMFSTYLPPFFHIFLSWIYRPLIWLKLEDWRIKIDIVIFALFYIIGFWCIYQITKKLFSKKIGLIILTILIFWYPFIFLNYIVMSENLFFPLLFLGLYFLIVKPLRPSTGLWLGLFWGIAFITRPIFALVLPIFVIWSLYYKINWKILINFIIVAAIIIASAALFNLYYTIDDAVGGAEKSISSNGGAGFAMLWCDAKSIQFNKDGYYFWFAPPANADYPENKRVFTTTPFANQDYYYKMGLNCLKQNPWKLIGNFSSIAKLFNSRLFPEVEGIKYLENFRLTFKIITGLMFIGGMLTIVGILGKRILIDKAIKKYFFFFALIILSLMLTVYLQAPGEERYIMPYAPLLIILSAPVFIIFFKKIKNGISKNTK